MSSVEILYKAIGFHHSGEQLYKRDGEGRLIIPLETVGKRYNYVDIGNNYELCTYGVYKEENRMFCYVHLRNVKKVNNTFLNEAVSHISKWVKLKILDFLIRLDEEVSWQEFLDGLPDDFKLNINNLILDPGFTNHAQNEERNTGIRIGSYNIHYPEEIPDSTRKLFEEEMNLKQLLINRDAYINGLTLQNVRMINAHLLQAYGKRNTLKKLQYKIGLLLKTPGKFDTGDLMINPDYEVRANGFTVSYDYEGPIPHLEYDVRLGRERENGEIAKTIVRAKMRFELDANGKEPQRGFTLHLPSNILAVIRQSIGQTATLDPQGIKDQLELLVYQKFVKFMDKLFDKHGLEHNKYFFDSPLYLYDGPPV